jgi:thioredoxin 2
MLEPQFRLAKLDTEAEPEIGARFQIQSIPTLAVFLHGREIARQSGAMDASRLASWVRRVAEAPSTGSRTP